VPDVCAGPARFSRSKRGICVVYAAACPSRDRDSWKSGRLTELILAPAVPSAISRRVQCQRQPLSGQVCGSFNPFAS
jgi:hypothetical protein